MAEYFIMNGRVIDPSCGLDEKRNIHVSGERVVVLTSARKAPSKAEVIDASGCIVAPGFIDMHVHLRDPGFEYKEDIESGTRAAAAGGFTTICCMPNTDPVNDCAAVTDTILERARMRGKIRVFPIGAISKGERGEYLAEIGEMARSGIVAISDDGRGVVNSALMRRAMEYAKAFDLPVIAHCEDATLSDSGVMHEGAISTLLGLRGIPSAAEEAMLARDIALVDLTGSRYHAAHLSAAGSVELIRQAKKRKLAVTAEVTPHHLVLTDEAVSGYDCNAKVNPPLRAKEDQSALIRGLADGTIDAIATDHAPHAITDKEVAFDDAAFGMTGLETALPLLLSLVRDRKLTLKRMIDAISCAPARILKLKGRGRLSSGAIADMTIFDPVLRWTLHPEAVQSRSHNTPFLNQRFTGAVRWTISEGKIVSTRPG